VILLVGLSELAWRIGLAGTRKKTETDKDSGTVRSAVLALLGLLLGFGFAIAAARNEARRELLGDTRFSSDSFFLFSSRSSLR
jgi:hypothetical protein